MRRSSSLAASLAFASGLAAILVLAWPRPAAADVYCPRQCVGITCYMDSVKQCYQFSVTQGMEPYAVPNTGSTTAYLQPTGNTITKKTAAGCATDCTFGDRSAGGCGCLSVLQRISPSRRALNPRIPIRDPLPFSPNREAR